jgi:hypothetical protein
MIMAFVSITDRVNIWKFAGGALTLLGLVSIYRSSIVLKIHRAALRQGILKSSTSQVFFGVSCLSNCAYGEKGCRIKLKSYRKQHQLTTSWLPLSFTTSLAPPEGPCIPLQHK